MIGMKVFERLNDKPGARQSYRRSHSLKYLFEIIPINLDRLSLGQRTAIRRTAEIPQQHDGKWPVIGRREHVLFGLCFDLEADSLT
jgi:hypothetical protein